MTANRYAVSLGVMNVFWNSTEMKVVQYCECAGSHCIVYFKMFNMMNFMLRETYLNFLKKVKDLLRV